MIFNALTLIVIGIGVFGTLIKKFNLLGVFLSINLIMVAIFLNLVITGGVNQNVEALIIGFLSLIAFASLNSIVLTIIYAYFQKKNTLNVEEIKRDD